VDAALGGNCERAHERRGGPVTSYSHAATVPWGRHVISIGVDLLLA
jgi:hypothetical protein